MVVDVNMEDENADAEVNTLEDFVKAEEQEH